MRLNAALLLLLLSAPALATPPAPSGWAVVLEPGSGSNQWALVPIPSLGTDPWSRPPDPPGWAVVSRPSRTGAQWVLVPAGEAPDTQGAPEPPAPPAPHAPPSPETPVAPARPAEPAAPPPPPAPLAPGDDADLLELEQRIVERINDARSEAGLPPLQPHPLVAEAARAHSEEMARLDYFAHESPTPASRRFTDRLKQAGAQSFGAAAENIAKGSYGGDPAAGIVQSWMDSPGHRENILSERYLYTGVGVAMRGGTLWSTQVFTSALE